MRARRQRVSGTRVEIAAYLALVIVLAIGAVILDDLVLGIGAGLAALALVAAYDWEHALGGMHALLWKGAELIGHPSVVQRRLLHDGRALRAGYVEGVGVRADQRGHGHGAAMMEALERVIRGAYDLGALGATNEAAKFYEVRGWELCQGPCSALTPTGMRRTPEADDCIYVLAHAVALDVFGELTCDWRDGDVW